MTINVPDRAYAAALIDNLGVLKLREVGPSLLPQVFVHGNVGALTWLAERCGTRVVQTSRAYTRFGCSEHCPEQHVHIESRSGRWSVTGARATILLWNVAPYMRVQAAAARRLVDAGLSNGYKTNVTNEMYGLGWDLPPFRDQPRARVQAVAS